MSTRMLIPEIGQASSLTKVTSVKFLEGILTHQTFILAFTQGSLTCPAEVVLAEIGITFNQPTLVTRCKLPTLWM